MLRFLLELRRLDAAGSLFEDFELLTLLSQVRLLLRVLLALFTRLLLRVRARTLLLARVPDSFPPSLVSLDMSRLLEARSFSFANDGTGGNHDIVFLGVCGVYGPFRTRSRMSLLSSNDLLRFMMPSSLSVDRSLVLLDRLFCICKLGWVT